MSSKLSNSSSQFSTSNSAIVSCFAWNAEKSLPVLVCFGGRTVRPERASLSHLAATSRADSISYATIAYVGRRDNALTLLCKTALVVNCSGSAEVVGSVLARSDRD